MVRDDSDPRQAPGGGSANSHPSVPTISLPKGGGAIHGIGEKFAANPVTGTGSMSVPIYTSPGRSGFGPQLALSYDSGSGNGPFGFGWSLSIPAIARKTDKGLPRYQDTEESDVFILSGAEDLVPALRPDGQGGWERDRESRDGYTISRYRPRTEGLFARIELWRQDGTGDTHWRIIARDNIASIYGDSPESRIADPNDDRLVFSWLLSRTYDDKGNLIVYRYRAENSDGVPPALHERNRTIAANRYLKRIAYGHQTPYFPADNPTVPEDWRFQAVFDYGEHSPEAPQVDDDERHLWACRPDPFSSYRAGFEIRTYRRCERVLMFHRFSELGETPCLVRSTDLSYEEEGQAEPVKSKVASFIVSATQSGYVRQADGYLKRSLPPLEFTYSQVQVDEALHTPDPASLENLPAGLEGPHQQWVDLDGEGLSGILVDQGRAWYYKRNLSPITVQEDEEGRSQVVAGFGPAEVVRSQASLADLGNGQQQLLDLAGDGRVDLVQLAGPVAGFYERTQDGGWKTFRSFGSLPRIDWGDPNLRFVDLTGDGHADILITEDEALTWYPSLAEEGFGAATTVRQMGDEERGPRLMFADGTQSVYLADMSGDGLADLVRIRNGEVCYWPNLGYGRFGAKITMSDAPIFDRPDQFDQRRIRVADIDGSGNTDLIYLGRDAVRLYFNRSGNGWSPPQELRQFPAVDNLASVNAVDLLGNGTACLVWSSPLPGNGRSPMYYVDLMGGQKPHLLVQVVNNLGAETHVHYAPSTRFYLADKAGGRPWITRLPFPVHVVERVETYDRISRNRFVTRYAYHHGYFDGEEREFGGFGLVEQWDTEEIAALTGRDIPPEASNIEPSSYVPPVLTRTWFHTGAYLDGSRISTQFEDEYYRESDASLGMEGLPAEQLRAMLLDDTILPGTVLGPDGDRAPWVLSAEEQREACRALRGSILRQEVYALDGTEEADRPYSASERNYTLEMLQPRAGNRHAVFFPHPRETVDYHYERKLYEVQGQRLADPRVTHAMTLVVDPYGNVRRSAAIAYGRRYDDPDPLLSAQDRAKQKRTRLSYKENIYTNDIHQADAYRAPLLCEARTYELLQVEPASNEPGVTNLFRLDEVTRAIEAAGDGLHDLPYEDVNGSGAQPGHAYRRLIEQGRTLFRPDDMGMAAGDHRWLLPLRQLQSLALPGESYQLAFTPGLLSAVYRRRRDGSEEELLPDAAAVLGSKEGDGGGYVDLDGDGRWWIPSGRAFYHPDPGAGPAAELAEARGHFYQGRLIVDPFEQGTTVAYDRYDLLLQETQDAVGNRATVGERLPDGSLDATQPGNDYRVLQPGRVMDANRNRVRVAFDALGLMVGTAVMGKPEETLGDSLDGLAADLTEAEILQHLAEPLANPQAILGRATTRLVYDLFAYQRTGDQPGPQPAVIYTLARETHDADLEPGQQTKVQHSLSYSDGFGREIQKKVQAEPGPVPMRDAAGRIIIGPDGRPEMTPDDVSPRWVGSGWMVFNNKGKPVRQYEPYFTDRHQFEFDLCIGVSPSRFYDPIERAVATLHADHTYEKLSFDPWRQTTYDVNDTVAPNAAGTQTGDPRTDPDIAGYVRGYFDSQPATWQTWYQQRIIRPPGDPERDAAQKAAAHADTPTMAYFDMLGRPFLSVAHNRYQQGGVTIDERYATRIELDIEDNQRQVVDALGRIIMRYDYDLLGGRIHQASMEAGERWTLGDVTGNVIRAWDSRGYVRRMAYDGLRRPIGLYVTENGAERLAERLVYGESQGEAHNQRTRVYQRFDAAGIVTHERYDFRGNLQDSKRELLPDYRQSVDWMQNPAANDGSFTTSIAYDALNRPLAITTPDGSVYRPTFNEANLLDKVDANLYGEQDNGQPRWMGIVTNLNYNAKGQRELIAYSNGARTTYAYDPLTLHLAHLRTTRAAGLNGLASQLFNDPAVVQDLSYTYDPAGNITRIQDAAPRVIFHNNEAVAAIADYTYDATYRLLSGTGREHIGQSGMDLPWSNANRRDYPFFGARADPNDPEQVRTYREQYVYDEAGNILHLIHQAIDGNWTRDYQYEEPSLLEPGRRNNRLTRTQAGSQIETYTYQDAQGHDVHGCMTAVNSMPIAWNFEDQLRQVDLGGGGTAYYVYNSGGQRVRRVINRQNGTRQKERIYLGGFEIYREYNGDGNTVMLERETLHIPDGEQRLAVVETRTQGSDPAPQQLIRYQLGNHLGSASLELDGQGQLISYEEYTPYGPTSYQAVRSQTETPKRYRYTGKERDEESGLYYHGARYYAPWLGRWINCDPISIKGGANLYSFTADNPVVYVDPRGTNGLPSGAVRKVGNIEEGLKFLERAGRKAEIEYSLVRETSTGQLVIMGGARKSMPPLPPGYTPLGHSHVAMWDSTSVPSSSDLNTFGESAMAKGGARSHWIFAEEDVTNLQYDPATKSIRATTFFRKGKVMQTIYEYNPSGKYANVEGLWMRYYPKQGSTMGEHPAFTPRAIVKSAAASEEAMAAAARAGAAAQAAPAGSPVSAGARVRPPTRPPRPQAAPGGALLSAERSLFSRGMNAALFGVNAFFGLWGAYHDYKEGDSLGVLLNLSVIGPQGIATGPVAGFWEGTKAAGQLMKNVVDCSAIELGYVSGELDVGDPRLNYCYPYLTKQIQKEVDDYILNGY